ncbi:MAG TPA: ABC transporter substrate-binding protein [Chloroflexota bacterium]|nr:ABC transporter substrate-binding protein [Chloroflexota bacterium]
MKRWWLAGMTRARGVGLCIAVLLAACGGGPAASVPPAGTGAAPVGAAGAARAAGSGPVSAATSAPTPLSSHQGYTSVVITILPAWAAQEAGYFREQGLDVELSRVGGGAPMLAALQNGDLEVAYSGAPALVLGYVQGLETQIFGALTNTLESIIFVRPEIQTVDDLRGKSIGVSNLLGITDIAARLGLQRLGLKPDEDVFSRQTGGMGESLAALDTGVVAGVSLGAPASFEARKRGYRALVDVSQLGIPFMGASVGATRRTLAERPAVAERTVRALAQAMSRLKTDRDFAVDVLVKYTQIDDRELLGEAVDYYRPLWAADVYPDPSGLQGVLDVESNPAARTTTPDEILDLRFVDALRASGFLEQLPQ